MVLVARCRSVEQKPCMQILYMFIIRAVIVIIFGSKNGNNFRARYNYIQNLQTLQRCIFLTFFNISPPNLAILLFPGLFLV